MVIKDFLFLFRPYSASDDEIEILNRRINATNLGRKHGETLFSQIENVESKAGVLLTHISMMIAITGLMLAVGGKNACFETIIALELVAYLFLALFCIRAQYNFDNMDFLSIDEANPDDSRSDRASVHERKFKSDIIYRERVFKFVVKSLYVLTFLLALTVIVGLFTN